MAWTKYQFLLAFLMVFTGSINTISIKWANETESKGRDGQKKKFNHPFFQAALMFVGEFLCFLVFKCLYFGYGMKSKGLQDEKALTKGNRDFNPFILFIPAVCDMAATSIMFVGLTLTYASSFQMFRGAVIIFVGLFSLCFLHRKLKWVRWLGIVFIIAGLTLVGLADFMSQEDSAGLNQSKSDIILGDVLIIAAQIVTATQMVVQEKLVVGKNIPPLQAVGWEGIFGFIVIALIHIVFYFIRADPPATQRPGDRLEDPIDAFVQIANNWQVLVATIVLVLSIAFFNFAGVSITKELSATTRMVLDSARTIVIWIFSLTVLGQKFHWLQLVGFILLLTGMALYNGIFDSNCRKKSPPEEDTNQNAEAEAQT